MSRTCMRTSAACALALAIVCASVIPAGAQSYGSSRGSTELTLFNGYYIASDLYTSIGSGAGGAQIGMANSYMWGGRLGFNPSDNFGLEFVYTRAGSDLDVRNGVSGYNPGNIGRLNLNSYDVDLLFLQPTPNPRTTGYFTLGFGWTVTDPDIQPSAGKSVDSKSLFAWNLGLGTKVDLNEKLLLRLEGRWRVTNTATTTSSGVYCDYWGYCYSYASDWYDSGELTAGLTYKLKSR